VIAVAMATITDGTRNIISLTSDFGRACCKMVCRSPDGLLPCVAPRTAARICAVYLRCADTH
jgi:hypothetical protein